MSRENLHSLRPGIIALSVAILLLSAVGVFAGLPDHASAPADTAHAQGEGAVDLDHKVYLPAVMKALDTTPPVVVGVEGASLSYDVDGQTIQRAIVVQDLGGTYSFDATGDEGDIPYGITSTLTIAGIQTNVDLTNVLVENQEGIEAQVTDACAPGENPCDISVSLNPTYQPESPIDDSVPYSFNISLVAYGGKTQLDGVGGEVFNPFELDDLGLPLDLDQIAAILQSDPRLGLNYKDTTKLDQSCGTGTHLGDMIEVYAHFEEGGPDEFTPPTYNVLSPIKYIPYAIQGDGQRKLVLNTFAGYNALKEPIYFSFIHFRELEENLRQEFADVLGIDPADLIVDYAHPDRQVGPYSFEQVPINITVEKGRHVGYMQEPWSWSPNWGVHHTLALHVNLTRMDSTDNLKPPEYSIPELTPHYMNWVIQELVLNHDLTIGIGYEGEDWCNHPELVLEHITPDIFEQITVEQWPEQPRHFDVSKKPLMESVSLSYEVDGQVIERTVVVRDGGTYLDASGDDGDIPFGITSTLSISGIRYAVTDVSIQDPQGIDAQVVDACEPGETPCDISISLNPTDQPESPIDASVPYSFCIGLETDSDGEITIGVAGGVFNPFTLDDLGYPEDPNEIAQILASNPEIGFTIKDNYKTDDSCGGPETHHMGTQLEVFTLFEEGNPDHIPAPTVTIYSPAKGIVVHLHGYTDTHYVINTLVGRGPDTENRYFSYIHVHSLEDSIKQEIADAAGVDPSELDIHYDDPDFYRVWINFEEPNGPIIEADRVVGYLNFWTWHSHAALYHVLCLHANYTWGVPTDNLEPVENALPELSPHYINWILKELVVDRDQTIGLGNEGNNRCTDPTRILDYINEDIMEQLIIDVDPYKDNYFWVHKR